MFAEKKNFRKSKQAQYDSKTNETIKSKFQSLWNRLTFTKLVAAITIILSFASYGYDYRFLDYFDIEPSKVNRSPTDFLVRADRPVAALADAIVEFRKKVFTVDFFKDAASELGLSTYLTTLVLCVAFLVINYNAKNETKIKAVCRAGVGYWTGALRWANATRKRRYLGFVIFVPIANTLTFLLVAYIFAILLWFAGVIVFVALSIVPLSPGQAAVMHAKKYVVEPEKCLTPGHSVPNEPLGALCIRVSRQGCLVAKGRMIDVAGNRVWLLHKTPWKVFSIPLDGNNIEYVNQSEYDEAVPQVGVLCTAQLPALAAIALPSAVSIGASAASAANSSEAPASAPVETKRKSNSINKNAHVKRQLFDQGQAARNTCNCSSDAASQAH